MKIKCVFTAHLRKISSIFAKIRMFLKVGTLTLSLISQRSNDYFNKKIIKILHMSKKNSIFAADLEKHINQT